MRGVVLRVVVLRVVVLRVVRPVVGLVISVQLHGGSTAGGKHLHVF